jgi:hypothetical protein
MPPEQRIRRHDGGDLPQRLTTHAVRLCGQPSPVIIREPQALAVAVGARGGSRRPDS